MNYLKAISLSLAFTCFSFLSFGQTEKGKILIGGSSGLSYSSAKIRYTSNNVEFNSGRSKNFEFSPHIGIFLTDGCALGVQIPVNIQSDDDDFQSTTFAFAPFAKYYFGKTNVKPFLQGTIGFGSTTVKIDTQKQTAGMTFYQFGGGLAVFLNNYISMDMGLNYNSTDTKYDEDSYKAESESSGLSANVGFTISF